METVIFNVAAAVGLSIAALFGTNERIIGENSYFAAKNNTLHARIVQEEPVKEKKQEHTPFFKAVAFTFDKERSIKQTTRDIDRILNDAKDIEIDPNGVVTATTGIEVSSR